MKIRQAMLMAAMLASALSLSAQEAKKEVILYKQESSSDNVIGIGYVYKKQFVERQPLVFLNCPKSYKLKKKGGKYMLRNSRKEYLPLSTLDTLACGIYFKKDGMACLDGKLFQNSSLYEGTFVWANNSENGKLLSTQKKASSFQYAFLGMTSYLANLNGIEVFFHKQNSETYSLKMWFPNGSDIYSIEGTFPKVTIDNEIYTKNIADILNRCYSKHIEFKNGDSFKGTSRATMQSSGGCKVVPLRGEYKYATGETFTGTYKKIDFDNDIIIPTNGKTTFSDGKKATGDWLKPYRQDFSRGEWQTIYKNSNGLTEIRDNAIALQQKKDEEKREKELAELREKMKEKRKKEAEKRKKEAEERKKEAKKRQLISKYGYRYGTLLAKGEIELGMTEAMVNEVYKKGWFDCNQSRYLWKRVDTWVFNKDKMLLTLAKEHGQDGVISMLFLETFGLTDLIVPSALQFVDGELTDIIR